MQYEKLLGHNNVLHNVLCKFGDVNSKKKHSNFDVYINCQIA